MKTRGFWVALAVGFPLALAAAGCGDNDYDAGNRLIVEKVEPVTPADSDITRDGFRFLGVEKTDDIGKDGDDATVDADGTQGNGFYDGPLETIEEGPGEDLVLITFRNTPRPGVDEGVELQVEQIVFTYFDSRGNTPAYAPQRVEGVSVSVPSEGTAELQVPIANLTMKTVADGIRDILIENQASEVVLTVVMDITARDVMNDDKVTVQYLQNISFFNPNKTL